MIRVQEIYSLAFRSALADRSKDVAYLVSESV